MKNEARFIKIQIETKTDPNWAESDHVVPGPALHDAGSPRQPTGSHHLDRDWQGAGRAQSADRCDLGGTDASFRKRAAISRAKHQVGSLRGLCQQLNGQKRQDRADNERLSTKAHRKKDTWECF
jgi:hypothetical protein